MHVLWENIICNNCALIDCADTSNYNFHFIFLNFWFVKHNDIHRVERGKNERAWKITIIRINHYI